MGAHFDSDLKSLFSATPEEKKWIEAAIETDPQKPPRMHI